MNPAPSEVDWLPLPANSSTIVQLRPLTSIPSLLLAPDSLQKAKCKLFVVGKHFCSDASSQMQIICFYEAFLFGCLDPNATFFVDGLPFCQMPRAKSKFIICWLTCLKHASRQMHFLFPNACKFANSSNQITKHMVWQTFLKTRWLA